MLICISHFPKISPLKPSISWRTNVLVSSGTSTMIFLDKNTKALVMDKMSIQNKQCVTSMRKRRCVEIYILVKCARNLSFHQLLKRTSRQQQVQQCLKRKDVCLEMICPADSAHSSFKFRLISQLVKA